MSVREKSSIEEAISLIFSPMRSLPTVQEDKTVTTVSAVLFDDLSITDGRGCRRVRLYNTDANASVGLFFVRAGESVSSLNITASCKLGPGQAYEGVLGSNMRVGAIASSGSVAVNCLVHDLG